MAVLPAKERAEGEDKETAVGDERERKQRRHWRWRSCDRLARCDLRSPVYLYRSSENQPAAKLAQAGKKKKKLGGRGGKQTDESKSPSLFSPEIGKQVIFRKVEYVSSRLEQFTVK